MGVNDIAVAESVVVGPLDYERDADIRPRHARRGWGAEDHPWQGIDFMGFCSTAHVAAVRARPAAARLGPLRLRAATAPVAA